MKERKQYQCEICGTWFSGKGKCTDCENSHIRVSSVLEEVHKPKGVASIFPEKIKVKMSNGDCRWYYIGKEAY